MLQNKADGKMYSPKDELNDIKYKATNLAAFSPQANCTDWATATCRRNLVQTFVNRGVLHGQHGGSPMVTNLSFLDQSCYFL
jgi:hypothetical protein